MAYGLLLKADGDEKCLSMLHAVEETLSRQLKACKAPLSKRRVIEGSYPAFYVFYDISSCLSKEVQIWFDV